MIDASVVMSKTRRLEILREYVAARSDATSAPDMRKEDHILKVMKIAVEEFASHAAAEIKRIESGHETDIATLEQEARQMRARMERLECENAQLTGLVETLRAELKQETCLSFRNQVAALEAQRDGLLAAIESTEGEEVMEFDECVGMVLSMDEINRLAEAVTKVKGGA
jgi:TolA-binding protein